LRDDFLALSIEDILTLNSYSQKMRALGYEQDYPNDEMITDERIALGKQIIEDVKSGARPKLKVVANIPYQITTKILLHLFGEIGTANANRDLISEINILVQKEFADRLIAKPGTKAYGAIGLFVNYWADVEHLVDVPRQCFLPSPKVDSTFIKIKLLPSPRVDAKNPKQLRRFIKAIFANRRKKLVNGLKAGGFSQLEIEKLDLPENLRGETLTLAEIAELVDKLGII